MKNTMITICLLVVAVMLISGCKEYPEYQFNGRIDNEEITFETKNKWGGEAFSQNGSRLMVVKSNGAIVSYWDNLDEDLKIESVDITTGGETLKYTDDVIGREILATAQTQFDEYLKKIVELKKARGMNALADE